MADYESRQEIMRRRNLALASALNSHSMEGPEYSEILQRISDDAIAFRKSHPHWAGYELRYAPRLRRV